MLLVVCRADLRDNHRYPTNFILVGFSGEHMIRVGGILTAVLLSLALGGIEPWSASADSPYALEQPASASEYENLEAVLETSLGQIIIEFFPKEASRHVEYFVK